MKSKLGVHLAVTVGLGFFKITAHSTDEIQACLSQLHLIHPQEFARHISC